MGFQISLCKFHKNSLSERLPEGKAVTLWNEFTDHKWGISLSESFFLILIRGYFLGLLVFKGSEISVLRFHRNKASKQLYEIQLQLSEWKSQSQSSFSESFFTVYNWIYILFHHSPVWAFKYHFANSTRTVLAKGFLRGKLNSVNGIHRSQRKFSESFFLILISGYFLWPCSLQRDPKYQFSDSTEIKLANSSTKYSCNTVSESHTSQRRFSETFFSFFIWGYFLFHHRHLWVSKYPFENSTRTVLANGFWGESCNSVRWIHRTQSSFSELLSSFERKIFPFSP